MKLFLSSVGIPDHAAFLSLFSKKQPRSAAIIPTAWNSTPSAKSAPFILDIESTLAGLGFATARVDLAEFRNNAAGLKTALGAPNLIWVTGGNTFYLNYWMRESGFDTLLPELLNQGVVYGGESAGAVVAGKTLHGIEILDNPADAPETIWPGLGLVDYGIIPHWGEEKYSGRLQQAYEEMRLFCPVKTVSNQSFIDIN